MDGNRKGGWAEREVGTDTEKMGAPTQYRERGRERRTCGERGGDVPRGRRTQTGTGEMGGIKSRSQQEMWGHTETEAAGDRDRRAVAERGMEAVEGDGLPGAEAEGKKGGREWETERKGEREMETQ